MKIGCFSVLLSQKPLNEALNTLKELGCEMVEIGTGNYPGNAHCNPEKLLSSPNDLREFTKTISDSGLEVSSLSCHGNPVHPNKEIAAANVRIHEATVKLAQKMGIGIVNCFSGCPGSDKDAKLPSWNIIPWPEDYSKSLEWQWKEVLIPFWKEQADFAEKQLVKIAFELHPGFAVYNTQSLLRIRDACGKVLGANFDPSHLFWQGMDPLRMIRRLKDAIFHVHAKDVKVDAANTELNGVLDTKPYGDEVNRSWIFRTVGYGHDVSWWKAFVSELRMIGYDYVLSIEHEDSLMSNVEGLRKAIATLKEAVISEKAGKMFWA